MVLQNFAYSAKYKWAHQTFGFCSLWTLGGQLFLLLDKSVLLLQWCLPCWTYAASCLLKYSRSPAIFPRWFVSRLVCNAITSLMEGSSAWINLCWTISSPTPMRLVSDRSLFRHNEGCPVMLEFVKHLWFRFFCVNLLQLLLAFRSHLIETWLYLEEVMPVYGKTFTVLLWYLQCWTRLLWWKTMLAH